MEDVRLDAVPTDEQFGDLIRHLRRIQAMSVEELGKRSRLGEDVVEELELGRRPATIAEMRALADGLGIRIDAIWRIWESRWGANG